MDNNDYKAALKLISDYNSENKIINENSLLHIALSDICFLRKLYKHTYITEETMKKENIFDKSVSEEHKKLIINGGLVILPKGNIEQQMNLAKLNDNELRVLSSILNGYMMKKELCLDLMIQKQRINLLERINTIKREDTLKLLEII